MPNVRYGRPSASRTVFPVANKLSTDAPCCYALPLAVGRSSELAVEIRGPAYAWEMSEP